MALEDHLDKRTLALQYWKESKMFVLLRTWNDKKLTGQIGQFKQPINIKQQMFLANEI